MIVHNVQQGTSAWLSLRAGVPTSSEFDKIITPGGKPSTSFDLYLYELLAERVMQRPRTSAVTMWMERGSTLEVKARAFYEFTSGATVDQVGFITNDAGTVGASPDGLVGDDGAVEIKCPSDHIHMAYLLASKNASVDKKYKVQVQGQMWITGRRWVDIISFHPDMPEALFRVERDEEFIALLEDRVMEFSRVLESRTLELMGSGLIAPKEAAPERPVADWLGVSDADVEAIMAMQRRNRAEGLAV